MLQMSEAQFATQFKKPIPVKRDNDTDAVMETTITLSGLFAGDGDARYLKRIKVVQSTNGVPFRAFMFDGTYNGYRDACAYVENLRRVMLNGDSGRYVIVVDELNGE